MSITVPPLPASRNSARWDAANFGGRRERAEGGRWGAGGRVGIDIRTIYLAIWEASFWVVCIQGIGMLYSVTCFVISMQIGLGSWRSAIAA